MSAVYGRLARLRRQWYEQHPAWRRQLGCPVVSVGNLVLGGSGKTPVVAMLARLLRDAGYAPAVVSRGYKRRTATRHPVVVSDRTGVLVDVGRSGDEPQLLARRLPGVPVVVGADRFGAGRVACERCGADVIVLDDGFQHLRLARTIDLLVMSAADLEERLLPAGRLREPLDAARRADALLVPDGCGDPRRLAERVGVPRAFVVRTLYQPLQAVSGGPSPDNRTGWNFPGGAGDSTRFNCPVVTMCAIARPERFVDAVRACGFDVREQVTYRDHHWFTRDEINRVEQRARTAGAEAILTTEKDAVKLEGMISGRIPVMFLPIDVQIEPADVFARWVLSRLNATERVR